MILQVLVQNTFHQFLKVKALWEYKLKKDSAILKEWVGTIGLRKDSAILEIISTMEMMQDMK